MSTNQSYEFANLNEQEELLHDIQALERKIEQHMGKSINLIAYTPVSDNEQQQIKSE